MPRPITHRRDNAHEWFWNNVDRSTGCWIWQGPKTQYGHGIASFDGRAQPVGNVAFQLIYGPLPEGKEACHNCAPNPDDGRCINPAHLWPGTHSENVSDRWTKWRDEHPGERMRYAAKGTHPRYEENRARYLAEKARLRGLADQIKAGAYRLPEEGQLVEPPGKERHTSKHPGLEAS